MPDLIAKSALAGHPALTIGMATLAEGSLTRITSIAPFPGRAAEVSAALAPLGLAFPAPGQSLSSGEARILWTSRDQAFLIGPAPMGLAGLAAVTDQSDGWASLLLSGETAEDVLARLYPLDLRATAFPSGQVARAPLNHMSSILLRSGPQAFDIMVFRSMARTAWHEIETAMTRLAARAALG